MRTPGEERGTHTLHLFLCPSLVDGDPLLLNHLFEEKEPWSNVSRAWAERELSRNV